MAAFSLNACNIIKPARAQAHFLEVAKPQRKKRNPLMTAI
jgi:hypothetical protein